MNARCTAYRVAAVAMLLAAAPAARAQWAVIDVGAIAQLIEEVGVLQQELATVRGELSTAQQTFSSMSGDRGMESLLSQVSRNYLPTSASDLQALLAGNATSFAALAGVMQGLVAQNAVLTPQQLASLAPDAAAQLQASRRTTALEQAIVGEALANTSDRFASLQQLITTIGNASDQKAVLDLGARIAAEEAMLQNEQTKLQVLQRALEAQQWADELREREESVALHGDFGARFAPAP